MKCQCRKLLKSALVTDSSVSLWLYTMQGSHASWKVLDFFVQFPGPGKWFCSSWKVLEI